VRRVSVVGVSGSGKTTVARALAARFGVPHVELDAIFHQPGWTSLEDEEFARRVAVAIAGDGWVVDGNCSRVRELLWSRADTVVVLDLPRWRVMSQLLVRTLRRGWTGEELWAGNRERPRNLIRRDPKQNILLWSWTTHSKIRQRYRAAAVDPQWSGRTFLRARSRQEVQALVGAVLPRPGGRPTDEFSDTEWSDRWGSAEPESSPPEMSSPRDSFSSYRPRAGRKTRRDRR
jgi:adenylate kinase family enzyme